LHHAEVELACLDGVYVEYRAPGGLNRAADTVIGAVLVHQAADSTAGSVVHTRDTARSDADELLLCSGRQGRHQGSEHGCGTGTDCQMLAKTNLEFLLHT